MGNILKIALVQQHAGKDIQDNINRGIKAFKRAAESGAGLIAFPELAFTPFYPQSPVQGDVISLTETVSGPTVDLFSRLAKEYGMVTVLNLFERDGSKHYDSSPVIDADGSLLGVTRMVHICDTPCFHERGYYYPGSGNPVVYDTEVGKIGIAICYDRHFPEYMRYLGVMQADLVIVPQAGSVEEWPKGLFEAEMRVAGFQNGYFTALCNRVGKEELITFEGKSLITSPEGQVVAQAPAGKDALLLADVDLDQVGHSHARRHFFPDRRPDLYRTWLNISEKLDSPD